jgi:hypothetical protein
MQKEQMKISIAIVVVLALIVVFFLGARYQKSREVTVTPADTSVTTDTQVSGTSTKTVTTSVKIPPANFVPVESDIIADVIYNQTMHAIYYKNENAAKITLSDGRVVMVGRTSSSDGDRYTNASGSFVFVNRGATASVIENGKITYGNCPQYN